MCMCVYTIKSDHNCKKNNNNKNCELEFLTFQ